MEPTEPVDNRRPDGTFGPGNNANPTGRPANGISLKEYVRLKFMKMNEEEKEAFLHEISKESQWKMGEGNPHATNEHTGKDGGPIIIEVPKEIAEKHDPDASAENNSA